nr:ESF1 [Cryptomonas curvata]
MDILIRYKTLDIKKRVFYNVHFKKKNDSDIYIETKKKKSHKNFRKYFRNKTLSKNLLLLNIDWNTINSADVYSILNPFVPKNGKIVSVLVISYFINFKKNVQYQFEAVAQFFAKENSSKNVIFGLVECDSIKTSKSIFRTCNKVELINPTLLIDMKFVNKLNKSYLKILEYTKENPANYFPQFTINKKKFPTFKHFGHLNKYNKTYIKKTNVIIHNSFLSKEKFSFSKKEKINSEKNIFCNIINKQLNRITDKFDKYNFVWIKDIQFSNIINFKFKNTDV